MNARPTALLALLGACTAPATPDSEETAPKALSGPGAEVELASDGLWMADDRGGLGLGTARWGRADALVEQPVSAPREGECWLDMPGLAALGCRPTLERPLLGGVERWARLGSAVQQGWTLVEAPSGEGPVVIEVWVEGAEPLLVGEQVLLEATDGRRWTYAGLRAWDDHQLPLDAWMTVEGDTIRILVDDTDATWPIHVDPVVSSASTTLTQSSSDFGIGVTLGNFTGDSYTDVAVGARFGTALYGEAFTYHGTSSGVNTTYARKLSGADYYGKFGEYVEGGGDIDGDGYDDLVVCEFYSERFFVYEGSSTGIGSAVSSTVTGVYGLGRGLATADWNNDGYDDVMAGAQEPTAEVYKGSSSGLNTTRYYTTSTLTNGPSVSTAGDVNGDGYEEFIYGVEGDNAAYVLMGSSSPPSSTTTLSRSGSSVFGFSVAGGGDIDGDGYDDVAVGDPSYSSSTGRVTVFYGSSSGLSTSSYDILSAPSSGTGFGYTVEMVGDVNGDGYDDLAVSDDYDHSYAYVFHGASSGINTSPVNTLSSGSANFGYDIAGRGDVNADGYDDVVFGDIGSTAYVYHGCPDADGDGYCTDEDCDDTDDAISPDATEICDSVDNDCDGLTDDADSGVSSASKSTWYRDADSDTYGTSATTTTACSKPTGYVSNSTDCNDSSASINPGATETTGDSTDQNCDGTETCYANADGDSYRTTSTVSSSDTDCGDSGEAPSTHSSGDCNDSNSAIYPGATEITGDGVDQNCDNAETCYANADGDAYRTSTTVSSTDSDCTDSGEALSSATSGDCDDSDSAINPAASEVCDGEDNDCDGYTDSADSSVDTDTLTTYYADDDLDGYGDASDSRSACDRPTGYVTDGTDCNDASLVINPGAAEITGDGVDQNCDDSETCYTNADGDAYRTSSTVSSADSDCTDSGEALSSATSGDCNDSSSAIHPAATEIAGDGVDQNCDNAESCYEDVDSDDYRTSTTTTSFDSDCSDVGEALSSVSSGDCDDADAAINPAASEVCDGDDNDCDGYTDSADSSVDASTLSTYYADVDDDGYGDPSDSTASCDLPSGYVADNTDCDDTLSSISPAATETTGDEVDSDCDDAEICYTNLDADGYRTDEALASADTDCDDAGEATSSLPGEDCDDTDDSIYPGAPDPDYDDIDQACDGDNNDLDGDGHNSVFAGGDDCDDTDATINPDATETWYDGVDSDCADDSDYDADADGHDSDGYGGADCDDADAAVNPDVSDTWYDGVDSDCGGNSDYDADADGQDSDDYSGLDCNDDDPSVYSGAAETWYDGVDSDCAEDSDYDADADGHDSDGYGGDDCDDTDLTVYPGATELADGLDNDCDGHDELYDGDADGLTDLHEAEVGTDPADPDTDGDSLQDGAEVSGGTDPLNVDSDGGGLDDGTEVGRGSDPNDAADDDLPLEYVKGGCACATEQRSPTGIAWLLALAPLALLRRKRTISEVL